MEDKGTFQTKLTRQSEVLLNEVEKKMAIAIDKVFNDLGFINSEIQIDIRFSRCHWSGSGWSPRIYIKDKDQRKSMLEILEGKLLKDFQESLDNFAWAVDNQRHEQT